MVVAPAGRNAARRQVLFLENKKVRKRAQKLKDTLPRRIRRECTSTSNELEVCIFASGTVRYYGSELKYCSTIKMH